MLFFKKIFQAAFLVVISFVWGTIPPSNSVAQAQADPPVMFIENVGQFAETVRFQAYGNTTTFSIAKDGVWLTILQAADNRQATDERPGQGVNLKLSFAGANPHPELEPFDRLDTQVSYLTGASAQSGVPVWGGVRYVDLYPGIDLEITGENGQLIQRFVYRDEVAAQNSTANIALRVEGAESISIDSNDRLLLTTAIGEISLPLPQVDGTDVQIAGNIATPYIEGNQVYQPFSTSSPASGSPAQIAAASDLIYSTFLGGAGNLDTGRGIAVDEAGHAYVTGQAYAGFPTTPGVFDPSIDGVFSDTFVVKLNPDGSDLVYATFVGGSDYDTATDIVIDEAGNAYITGYTTPTSANAFDNTLGGESDAFVAKLNSDGTQLLFGTYLGGSDNEFCWGIDIDQSGNAYITGFTPSTDFPTTPGVVGPTLATWYDVFVTKFNADASELMYSTLVGGESADYSFGGVAVDGSGNAYVTGYTHSTDFPVTPGAFDTEYNNQEIFVFKLNADASDLLYATYLGGSESEYAEDIFVDENGNIYLTGTTRSLDFPVTPGAFDTDYNSDPEAYEGDGFIAKLNAAGSDILYGTYLGGNGDDVGQALVVDGSGNIYVTGETESTNFPTTPNAFDSTFAEGDTIYPPDEAFVTKLTADGSALAYSTFLGDDGWDYGYDIDADDSGNVYVTGASSSAAFPITAGAFDPTLDGFKDAIVSKLATGNEPTEPEPTPTPSIPDYDCAPTTLGNITVGDTPRGIALDVARQRAYVANYGSGSVSVIDTGTNTVINTITGVPSANGITYDGLHNMLWVTNTDNDTVTPIEVNQDATGFTVQSAVTVGDGPWGVVFDPIYGYLYVANSLDDSVSVVNVAQRAVDTTLTGTFSQPYHIATTPVTGKVYVANFGNNTVTVIKGTSIQSVVNLWDSAQPYGIAVDEPRNLVYVSTVATNRIVAIGTLNNQPDQFLGWSMFFRGYNRHRPLPLRVIAVNPEVGPTYDGGHIWATTSTGDGSEQNQVLLIPKGWSSYFHVPLPQNVQTNPAEGLAIDRTNDRVYVSSGVSPGVVTVLGDHDNQCPAIAPATAEDTNGFSLDVFSRAALMQGDATTDGLIDIFDLTYIASRYNSDDYTADVNGDGLVDIFDLSFVASRYGQQIND